jgi:Fic family protein
MKPRKGSAVGNLLTMVFDHPVMNAGDLERYSGTKTVQTYAAIDRLVEAGVIREITGRKRDRVWMASDVLGELDDLDRGIQEAMR